MTRRTLRPSSSRSSLRLGYGVMLANRCLYQCAKYAISKCGTACPFHTIKLFRSFTPVRIIPHGLRRSRLRYRRLGGQTTCGGGIGDLLGEYTGARSVRPRRRPVSRPAQQGFVLNDYLVEQNLQKMLQLPDFRSRSITATRGRCGKPSCRCHQHLFDPSHATERSSWPRLSGMPEAAALSWVGYEAYLPRTRSTPEKSNSNL